MAGTTRKPRRPEQSFRREPPVIDAVAVPVEPAAAASHPGEATGEPVASAEPIESAFPAAAPIPSETLSKPDEPTVIEPARVDQDGTDAASAASSSTEPNPASRPAADTAGPVPPSTPKSHGRDSSVPGWLTPFAIVVAVLLLGVVVYIVYDASGESRVADLESQTQMLQQRLVSLEQKTTEPAADSAALDKRLNDLAGQQSSLGSGLAEVRRLAQQAAAAPAAPPVPDVAPALKAIDGRLDELGQAVASLKPAIDDLGALKARVDGIAPLSSRVDDLAARVVALKTALDDLPRIDLAPLESHLDALGSRVAPLEADMKAAGSPQRVAERRAAPLAVTAEAVLRAVESGQPFPDALKALTAIGVDGAKLAPLSAVSASGAPTLADLRADLAGLRDRVVADGTPAPAGSYLDRILAGANAVVQVRPTGSVVGDTPTAIVTRIDADLAADDLGGALAEWEKLPETSRVASKGLADRIRLRQAAEGAARSLSREAIGAMAGASGTTAP